MLVAGHWVTDNSIEVNSWWMSPLRYAVTIFSSNGSKWYSTSQTGSVTDGQYPRATKHQLLLNFKVTD